MARLGDRLADDAPALGTRILARAASERPQNLTTSLLTLMSAEGRLVPSTPTGPGPAVTIAGNRSRDGGPGACSRSTRRGRNAISPAAGWLAPAAPEDLQCWTGWSRTTTRRALTELAIEEVDLHGHAGINLARPARQLADGRTADPAATLLPAFDPTPMGCKHRDWLLGINPAWCSTAPATSAPPSGGTARSSDPGHSHPTATCGPKHR
jgi:hypothetical protein